MVVGCKASKKLHDKFSVVDKNVFPTKHDRNLFRLFEYVVYGTHFIISS